MARFVINITSCENVTLFRHDFRDICFRNILYNHVFRYGGCQYTLVIWSTAGYALNTRYDILIRKCIVNMCCRVDCLLPLEP